MVLKAIAASLGLLLLCTTAEAAKQKNKVECSECHDELERGKSVHPAISMGCDSCHTAVDATVQPHRIKNKIPKGLSANLPDLCYGCHDKALFTKKYVHPALAMGCTVCHNPHASNAASLLIDPVGKLCTSCHEKQSSGKHVMTRFAAGDDHPLKSRTDPSDSSREISCISCHNPHSSTKPTLFRNENDNSGNMCLLCHRKISVRATAP